MSDEKILDPRELSMEEKNEFVGKIKPSMDVLVEAGFAREIDAVNNPIIAPRKERHGLPDRIWQSKISETKLGELARILYRGENPDASPDTIMIGGKQVMLSLMPFLWMINSSHEEDLEGKADRMIKSLREKFGDELKGVASAGRSAWFF